MAENGCNVQSVLSLAWYIMHIIVGSNNPVKIRAVESAFTRVFPQTLIQLSGCSAASGVSDQPMSDGETLLGAQNRAADCQRQHPEADYWVGLEGGCQFEGDALEAYAWMVVRTLHQVGKARTAAFILPDAVAKLVRQGHELGDADDQVFGQTNSKQSQGAVGLLTHNIIDRQSYYEHALILALIPFLHTDLYGVESASSGGS